eukprot:scaffold6711_cov118-Isochrysis_galbana.AAC.25
MAPSSFGWSPPRWFRPRTKVKGAARARVDSTDQSSPQQRPLWESQHPQLLPQQKAVHYNILRESDDDGDKQETKGKGGKKVRGSDRGRCVAGLPDTARTSDCIYDQMTNYTYTYNLPAAHAPVSDAVSCAAAGVAFAIYFFPMNAVIRIRHRKLERRREQQAASARLVPWRLPAGSQFRVLTLWRNGPYKAQAEHHSLSAILSTGQCCTENALLPLSIASHAPKIQVCNPHPVDGCGWMDGFRCSMHVRDHAQTRGCDA